MIPKWTDIFLSKQCGRMAAALSPFQSGFSTGYDLVKNIVNVTFEINLNINVFLLTIKQIL